MQRSIIAIVAGYFYIGLLSVGADAALRAIVPSAFPDGAMVTDAAILLAMIAYVAFFATTGSYITARLAPAAPMRHALLLGVLGLVTQIGMLVAFAWAQAPAWYHLLNLILVMPYAFIGGALREREVARAANAIPALRA
ncbi:MAG TPA: hypothetical protein VFQ45_08955 [Longimicrobium sp.]|nr:hypothetical protein [Longimicrobium sp.]